MEPPCQELFLGDQQIGLNTTGFIGKKASWFADHQRHCFIQLARDFFDPSSFFKLKERINFCHCIHRHPQFDVRNSKGKVGYPWESTRDTYQHIPPIYGLYNGCMRQYAVKMGEQLLGYTPKDLYFFRRANDFYTRGPRCKRVMRAFGHVQSMAGRQGFGSDRWRKGWRGLLYHALGKGY